MAFFKFTSLPCDCGSGELSQENLDGHGIYLFRSCPRCFEEKVSKFRPDIFSNYETDEPIEDF
jgi:hypothetical protein